MSLNFVEGTVTEDQANDTFTKASGIAAQICDFLATINADPQEASIACMLMSGRILADQGGNVECALYVMLGSYYAGGGKQVPLGMDRDYLKHKAEILRRGGSLQ